MEHATREEPITFERSPASYAHWKLTLDGPLAKLVMAVQEDRPLRPGYRLKLNSYDLGVDLELYDVVQRLRFEHPEVRCIVLTGALERVFCAGANINMLASSTHSSKVNFCKFTNETRLAIETLPQHRVEVPGRLERRGRRRLRSRALACDEIILVTMEPAVTS